jgi:hypothetical protein
MSHELLMTGFVIGLLAIGWEARVLWDKWVNYFNTTVGHDASV